MKKSFFAIALSMLPMFSCLRNAVAAPGIEWSGSGGYRILVEVTPFDIGSRASDEMPAELVVDLKAKLAELKIEDQKVDLSSLQVMRYNPATGKAEPYEPGYEYGHSPADRPFRWYDASIPYDFPQILGAISRTNGELHREKKPRAGYFYNVLGDGDSGRLAWSHTQTGQDSSYYAIYFNLLPKGKEPTEMPPRGWLGDGMPRADRWGTTTTGNGHTVVTIDDWNDDGLPDIVYGEQYGCIFYFPNRGTRDHPEFPYQKMIFDADGVPIDLGLHASPLVVDWDGDGKKDLLAGVYENHVVWFRNEGTNRDRRLVYKGFIQADGVDLKLPIKPVVGRSEAIFNEDYYPVLQAVDWNGDGRMDLLAGGYVTGRIFFYENTGPASDGTPILKLLGPIEADGKPLNVADWCASPCAADFNGDGKLDLITGRFAMTPESQANKAMLRYYENVGTRTAPQLVEKPFPKTGDWPAGGLAVVRAADMDGDGLLDLVVSPYDGNIFIFKNVGSTTQPMFDTNVKPLKSDWGNSTIETRQFIDWEKDGWPDYVTGYQVHLNAHAGNPYHWDKTVNVLPPGANIAHPSGIGDDWFWPYLSDFDQDGKIDVLFGDWAGNIWYHHNNTVDPAKPEFDLTGYKLKTTDGKEIKVGPINADIKTNFQALQGARTVFTVADIDGDGKLDLIVGDTYGMIRFYRNAGTNAEPVFDPPIQVADVKVRMLLDADDWDGDGRPDVIVGSVNHHVHVFLNKLVDGRVTFEEDKSVKLPWVLEPGVVMVDMNRDGDKDLFLTSTQGSVLMEHSFARHGYAQAKLLKFEAKN
jgi:hypothetical protein